MEIKSMNEALKKLNQQIEALALEAVMLDTGDIPGLGTTLKSLESIEDLAISVNEESLIQLIRAMKEYIEMAILGECSELASFELAISKLQEICRDLINGQLFAEDLSSLMASLGSRENEISTVSPTPADDTAMKADKTASENCADKSNPDNLSKLENNTTNVIISEEDKEIIADFVTESLENLETIEIRVMDLEQDPSDLETVNAIFRPFHTVKGVSGFLNFNKINKLSHAVENLLDKARNGELEINPEIIDVVLDCVDLLKRMIANVQDSLSTGAPPEGDFDIEDHIAKVDDFLVGTDKKDKKVLGQILVEKGAISKNDLDEALNIQEKHHEKKIGEILIEEKKIKANEVVSALRDQRKSNQPANLQVKIDTDKLDNVVDMVGELAIAQSMLRQNELIKTSSDRKLDHIVNQLNQITSGLQKTAMTLRMVPIKHTFQKMLRLVRDLTKKAGKEVELVMSGQDTEIDRNMVEEIYEPMVHIIRNAVDHGMESPDERKAADKPRKGTINLDAYHKGGEIVIEIKDNGRGLNQEKILAKALALGLVQEGEKLTEGEIHNLIFHPGFSTAEKITDISGRGVGMDVVKYKIVDRLRGRIEVLSIQGKGTTILIRLPLTLAILDGMVVRLNGQRYIIPTLSVQESFKPRQGEYHTVKGQGEMLKVRNSLIPLVRLDKVLSLNGNKASKEVETTPWERLVVVVENQRRACCLLIDELLGQEEVVIKNLGETFQNVKGIAGGTIMGDGRISLILDIAGILDMTSEG